MNKWAIVKVLCNDGIERVGMIIEEESPSIERVIESGLHEEMASAMISYHAKELGLEQFDNNEHEAIEY